MSPYDVADASEMSVEEAIAMTQMAFRMLEQRLFEGGAISTMGGTDFDHPKRLASISTKRLTRQL